MADAMAERIRKVEELLSGAADKEGACELLGQVTHDINSPLWVMLMEVDGLKCALESARAAHAGGAPEELGEALSELSDAFALLEKALDSANAYVKALQSLKAKVSGD